MPNRWTQESILALGRSFQGACVLIAGADLELFELLARKAMTAPQVAAAVAADVRGVEIVLNALAALGLLDKSRERFKTPRTVVTFLTAGGPQSVLAMIQHQGNCLRRWAQIAAVAKSGLPCERSASVRGPEKDHAAFIQAMDDLSRETAPKLIGEIARKIPYTHVLDVGGGSGTWTLAWLRANRKATATLFDLPTVIPMAERRIGATKESKRVELAPGDFSKDPLPPGADLAWVSAIIHQQSRAENVVMFQKIHDALDSGGHIVIRDVVMDDTHTQPAGGALFAVNMLVATATGTTFSLREICADLKTAGFTAARLLRRDPWMNSIVVARKA